jgi:hypothetical protein
MILGVYEQGKCAIRLGVWKPKRQCQLENQAIPFPAAQLLSPSSSEPATMREAEGWG